MIYLNARSKSIAGYMTGLLLLAFMAAMLPFMNNSLGGGSFLNAAATIKTQAAANKISNGIRGIDVSRHQGVINWKLVAQDNVKFAFIRASSGALEKGKYVLKEDPYFVSNAKNAHANGIKVGAYHAALFNNRASMQKEAEFFIKQLKKVTITYPVVLDLEYHRGLSKNALTTLSKEFMSTVQKAGYKVLFYSYQNFIDGYINRSAINEHELWVANYLEEPKGLDHKMWQHTAQGKVKGISGNVDINIAYKDFSTNQIRIDKSVSDSAKNFLNQYYDTNIDLAAKLDLNKMNQQIARALQQEINVQLKKNVKINSTFTVDQAKMLATINFKKGETKGRITSLIQIKLIYKGFYSNKVNGLYDQYMSDAISAFQSRNKLKQTGTMDEATWIKLMDAK